MLESKGVESTKKFIKPEITKLLEHRINKLLINQKTSNQESTKFVESLKESSTIESLKPIDNSRSQLKSVESLLSLFANNDNKLPQNLQQRIQLFAKFGTKENINTALQIYKDKGIDSCINYSDKVCVEIIEKKVKNDLQIMKKKFDPNYDLGNSKFSDIVVYDFQGKSHAVPEDYLTAIGRDKQIMQYINPSSEVATSIKNELKQSTEIRQNQDKIRVKL